LSSASSVSKESCRNSESDSILCWPSTISYTDEGPFNPLVVISWRKIGGTGYARNIESISVPRCEGGLRTDIAAVYEGTNGKPGAAIRCLNQYEIDSHWTHAAARSLDRTAPNSS
jgi:hypothetical protein